ncbi:hypothetical protein QAD02_018291 [Eretmocerus hayati]|uniref:Uncharacterized protein n=1 Tax=Eretmocerus hayati TaxID=131215 RepID=A0ACC2PGQ8_9HYME|nr:hypothetical protein QAD02_018291 [Eretmocerus hayati]
MKKLLITLTAIILTTCSIKVEADFIEASSGVSQVSIKIDGKHQGVGVIVGSRFVITTWTLLEKILEHHTQKDIKIVTGSGDDDTAITVGVEKIDYYYDRYEVESLSKNGTRPIHNIAIIYTDGRFDTSNNQYVIPATMANPGYQAVKDSPAEIKGFDENVKLVYGEMTIVSRNMCAPYYEEYNYTYPGEECAIENEPGQKPCYGDEGTPLYVNDVLVGISSWLEKCEDPNYPSVFTSIGYYRDWIDASMNIMSGGQVETYSDDFEKNQGFFDSIGEGILNVLLINRGVEGNCEMGPKRLNIDFQGCYWRCRNEKAAAGNCEKKQCRCVTFDGDFFLYNRLNKISNKNDKRLECFGRKGC